MTYSLKKSAGQQRRDNPGCQSHSVERSQLRNQHRELQDHNERDNNSRHFGHSGDSRHGRHRSGGEDIRKDTSRKKSPHTHHKKLKDSKRKRERQKDHASNSGDGRRHHRHGVESQHKRLPTDDNDSQGKRFVETEGKELASGKRQSRFDIVGPVPKSKRLIAPPLIVQKPSKAEEELEELRRKALDFHTVSQDDVSVVIQRSSNCYDNFQDVPRRSTNPLVTNIKSDHGSQPFERLKQVLKSIREQSQKQNVGPYDNFSGQQQQRYNGKYQSQLSKKPPIEFVAAGRFLPSLGQMEGDSTEPTNFYSFTALNDPVTHWVQQAEALGLQVTHGQDTRYLEHHNTQTYGQGYALLKKLGYKEGQHIGLRRYSSTDKQKLQTADQIQFQQQENVFQQHNQCIQSGGLKNISYTHQQNFDGTMYVEGMFPTLGITSTSTSTPTPTPTSTPKPTLGPTATLAHGPTPVTKPIPNQHANYNTKTQYNSCTQFRNVCQDSGILSAPTPAPISTRFCSNYTNKGQVQSSQRHVFSGKGKNSAGLTLPPPIAINGVPVDDSN